MQIWETVQKILKKKHVQGIHFEQNYNIFSVFTKIWGRTSEKVWEYIEENFGKIIKKLIGIKNAEYIFLEF